jgi:hypothetical protein
MITKTEKSFTKSGPSFTCNLHEDGKDNAVTVTIDFPSGNMFLHMTSAEAACLADAIKKVLP